MESHATYRQAGRQAGKEGGGRAVEGGRKGALIERTERERGEEGFASSLAHTRQTDRQEGPRKR